MHVASAEAIGLQQRQVVRTLIDERSCLRQELNSALSRRFWDLEHVDDRYAIDPESWRDDDLPALIRRLDADVSAAEAALEGRDARYSVFASIVERILRPRSCA